MNEQSSQLPWNELQRTEGGIPWPALRTFAAALATNRELARELFEAYDRAFAKTDLTDNADLYVPAIFALAAPRLDDEQRREIGAFLVQKLAEAGHEDADVSMEILMAAAGTLGPVIVPAVLDTIAKEPDTRGAWLYLWSLTTLAVRTDDPDLRSRVVQACVDLLERADPGRIDLMDAARHAFLLESRQLLGMRRSARTGRPRPDRSHGRRTGRVDARSASMYRIHGSLAAIA